MKVQSEFQALYKGRKTWNKNYVVGNKSLELIIHTIPIVFATKKFKTKDKMCQSK